MRLCWECHEDQFKRGIPIRLWDHCHHDKPEEKPKCWCEKIDADRFSGWSVEFQSTVCKLKFCPECGRLLS